MRLWLHAGVLMLAVLQGGGTIVVSTKDGYDVVERCDAGGGIVWYAVLRPAGDVPLRAAEEGLTVKIWDGGFVRVSDTSIPAADGKKQPLINPSLVIQRTVTGAPPFDVTAAGFTVEKSIDRAAVLRKNDWLYAAFGRDPTGAPEVIVRLAPALSSMEVAAVAVKNRWMAGPQGLGAVDDGTLTVAEPIPDWFAAELRERERNREAVRSGAAVPPIKASRWIHSIPLDLAGLRGKVVVLDFWGVWCAPCVAAIPEVKKLVAEVASDEFVLIAVHSEMQGEKVEQFLTKTPFNVPIAIDTGETARAYGVEMWPTYVLIDRSGHVVRAGAVPRAEDVKKLLNAGSAAPR